MTLMGQSVTVDTECSSQHLCVNNPSWDSQTDFAFDDGMPLACKGTAQDKTFLRGLHAQKIDPCTDGCPRLKFLDIKPYLDWISARIAL